MINCVRFFENHFWKIAQDSCRSFYDLVLTLFENYFEINFNTGRRSHVPIVSNALEVLVVSLLLSSIVYFIPTWSTFSTTRKCDMVLCMSINLTVQHIMNSSTYYGRIMNHWIQIDLSWYVDFLLGSLLYVSRMPEHSYYLAHLFMSLHTNYLIRSTSNIAE